MASSTNIILPTLRQDQASIILHPAKFKVVRCGRRWGKTVILESLAADAAARGKMVAVYAPVYATVAETYNHIEQILYPLIKTHKAGHEMRTTTGGGIDFWSLEVGGLFGRGREYDLILIDEAAFASNQTIQNWQTAISPTLWVRDGQAYVFSTPDEPELSNFFFALHEHDDFKYQDNRTGFKVFHRPSWYNPLIPRDVLRNEKRTKHPLAWRQEACAEFTDWKGAALFDLSTVCEFPSKCDYTFVTVDSALKSGSQHDGTAIMYWAYSDVRLAGAPKLFLLDWEIHQIDSALLIGMMKNVLARAHQLNTMVNSRHGFGGCHIEDKASGITLLQQAQMDGLPCHAINSVYTSMGKDERALAIVNSVFAKDVQFTRYAYDKVMPFKGETKNHALSQISKFRIGDKDAHKRADDLFDTFAYGVIQSLKPEIRLRKAA